MLFHHNYFYKQSEFDRKMISLLEKNRWFSWTITIIIAIMIFYISSLTFPPPPVGPPSINAIVYHISAFFLLAFFLLVSVLGRKWDSRKITLSVLIVAVYAALDELHQFFVPGRYMSFNDFLLDFTGITISSTVYFILIFLKKS